MTRPFISAPKPSRVEDLALIDEIREEQSTCLIGMSKKYGMCWGEHDMHHIDTKGSGGGDLRDNLIRLCRHHHQMAHNGKIPKSKLFESLQWFNEYYIR